MLTKPIHAPSHQCSYCFLLGGRGGQAIDCRTPEWPPCSVLEKDTLSSPKACFTLIVRQFFHVFLPRVTGRRDRKQSDRIQFHTESQNVR